MSSNTSINTSKTQADGIMKGQQSTIFLRRNQIKTIFMTPQQPAVVLNMANNPRRVGERIADLQSLKPTQSSSTADESLNQSFVYNAHNPEAFSSTSMDVNENEGTIGDLNCNIKRQEKEMTVFNKRTNEDASSGEERSQTCYLRSEEKVQKDDMLSASYHKKLHGIAQKSLGKDTAPQSQRVFSQEENGQRLKHKSPMTSQKYQQQSMKDPVSPRFSDLPTQIAQVPQPAYHNHAALESTQMVDTLGSTQANFNNFFNENTFSPPDSAAGGTVFSSQLAKRENVPPQSEASAHFRLTFSSHLQMESECEKGENQKLTESLNVLKDSKEGYVHSKFQQKPERDLRNESVADATEQQLIAPSSGCGSSQLTKYKCDPLSSNSLSAQSKNLYRNSLRHISDQINNSSILSSPLQSPKYRKDEQKHLPIINSSKQVQLKLAEYNPRNGNPSQETAIGRKSLSKRMSGSGQGGQMMLSPQSPQSITPQGAASLKLNNMRNLVAKVNAPGAQQYSISQRKGSFLRKLQMSEASQSLQMTIPQNKSTAMQRHTRNPSIEVSTISPSNAALGLSNRLISPSSNRQIQAGYHQFDNSCQMDAIFKTHQDMGKPLVKKSLHRHLPSLDNSRSLFQTPNHQLDFNLPPSSPLDNYNQSIMVMNSGYIPEKKNLNTSFNEAYLHPSKLLGSSGYPYYQKPEHFHESQNCHDLMNQSALVQQAISQTQFSDAYGAATSYYKETINEEEECFYATILDSAPQTAQGNPMDVISECGTAQSGTDRGRLNGYKAKQAQTTLQSPRHNTSGKLVLKRHFPQDFFQSVPTSAVTSPVGSPAHYSHANQNMDMRLFSPEQQSYLAAQQYYSTKIARVKCGMEASQDQSMKWPQGYQSRRQLGIIAKHHLNPQGDFTPSGSPPPFHSGMNLMMAPPQCVSPLSNLDHYPTAE